MSRGLGVRQRTIYYALVCAALPGRVEPWVVLDGRVVQLTAYVYTSADWISADELAGTEQRSPVHSLSALDRSRRSAVRRALGTLAQRGLVELGYGWEPRPRNSEDYDFDRRVRHCYARLSARGPRLLPRPVETNTVDALDGLCEQVFSRLPVDDTRMAYLVRQVSSALGYDWPVYYVDHLRANGDLGKLHDAGRGRVLASFLPGAEFLPEDTLHPSSRVLDDGSSSWPAFFTRRS